MRNPSRMVRHIPRLNDASSKKIQLEYHTSPMREKQLLIFTVEKEIVP